VGDIPPQQLSFALRRNNQRTFLELEDVLSRVDSSPQSRHKRSVFENNICLIIHEMEGVTRSGGISASYLVSTFENRGNFGFMKD
jgi:hypothetical protein